MYWAAGGTACPGGILALMADTSLIPKALAIMGPVAPAVPVDNLIQLYAGRVQSVCRKAETARRRQTVSAGILPGSAPAQPAQHRAPHGPLGIVGGIPGHGAGLGVDHVADLAAYYAAARAVGAEAAAAATRPVGVEALSHKAAGCRQTHRHHHHLADHVLHGLALGKGPAGSACGAGRSPGDGEVACAAFGLLDAAQTGVGISGGGHRAPERCSLDARLPAPCRARALPG